MTECERIVREGKLKEDFFKEEVRNDFLVDLKRKQIWAIELDLLIELDRVCKKYNLRYWIAYGSLLGAIRHKGFIPWDDDTDVLMPREDYEQLIIHGSEFQHPYFFQTPYTDEGYFYAHARIRNSNTTFIQRPFCHQQYNMGVFVDILPLDNFVPNEKGKMVFADMSALLVDMSTSMKVSNPHPNERDAYRIKTLSVLNPIRRYENLQSLAKTFENEITDFYFPSAALTYGYDRSVLSKDDFNETIYVDFEGFKVPVPAGYEHFLRYVYGDYNILPPIEKRGTWHGDVWFDADKPYNEVKKEVEYIKWSNNPNY